MENKFKELITNFSQKKVNDYLIHLLKNEESQGLVFVSRQAKT